MEMKRDIIRKEGAEVGMPALSRFLLEDPNVLFAVLFGSRARGKQKRGSNLDLAVFFLDPPQGLEMLGLVNTLSNISGMQVDLVPLNSSSPLLRHQVMKYGTKLFVKDELQYRRFREKLMTDFEEYKYVSGMAMYA